MPHLGHHGKGSGVSCMITTLSFKFIYTKCYQILTGMWALSGHPSTGQATKFNTQGKETMGVSLTPPPFSTSRLWKNFSHGYSPHFFKGGRRHFLATIFATYLCSFSLPKGGSLPRHPPLVRILPHFSQDKTRCACHVIGLPQIFYIPTRSKIRMIVAKFP